jgi:hypothetical protein
MGIIGVLLGASAVIATAFEAPGIALGVRRPCVLDRPPRRLAHCPISERALRLDT